MSGFSPRLKQTALALTSTALLGGLLTDLGHEIHQQIIEASWSKTGLSTRAAMNGFLHHMLYIDLPYLGAFRDHLKATELKFREGHEFKSNPENLCFFRGECVLDGPDSPEAMHEATKKRMEELMTYGRSPPVLPMRPKAAGYEFSELITLGHPILALPKQVIPPRWTSGVISMSSDFRTASRYADIFIIAAPKKIFSISELDHQDLDGLNSAREFEISTPGIRPQDLLICASYETKTGQITSVMFDESRIAAHGPLVIDQQMQKFMAKLDPLDPEQAQLLKILKAQWIQPARDIAQEYIEAESKSIYENYEKTVLHLLKLYEHCQTIIDRSPQSREGLMGEVFEAQIAIQSLNDFLSARLPTFHNAFETLEKSREPQIDPIRLENMRDNLLRAGVPNEVLCYCLGAPVASPDSLLLSKPRSLDESKPDTASSP